MQLTNAPSAPPTPTRHPESAALDTAAASLDAPDGASDASPSGASTPPAAMSQALDAPAGTSIAPPADAPTASPADPEKAPVATIADVVFGPDQFTIKPSPGTILTSQGIFAVFHTPNPDGGYVDKTETIEYIKVVKGPGVASDEFIGHHKFLTEEYKTSVTNLKDLPSWALALKAAPPSDTIEGGADHVAETFKSDASAITTPVRSGTVNNITTPVCSGTVDNITIPVRSGTADNITTPSRAGTVDSVSTPGTDSAANSFPAIFTQVYTPKPLSGDIDVPAKTTSARIIARSTGAKTNTKRGPQTTTRTTGPKITSTNTASLGPGLFESLDSPLKPVLSNDLDKTERRQAIINFYFDKMEKFHAAEGALALPEVSPAIPTARIKTGDKFSAFTPNTTKFFDDCEAMSTQILALPSLTPMFQASYKPTKCERRAVTAMNLSAACTPLNTPAVLSTFGAGPLTAVTSVPGSSKQLTSASNSVTTASAASGCLKRTVVEIISSDEDEVEIIATTSTRKGKGKAPAGPKKLKGI